MNIVSTVYREENYYSDTVQVIRRMNTHAFTNVSALEHSTEALTYMIVHTRERFCCMLAVEYRGSPPRCCHPRQGIQQNLSRI